VNLSKAKNCATSTRWKKSAIKNSTEIARRVKREMLAE
jgi:hypothetical protein